MSASASPVPVRLLGLGTHLPPHRLPQDLVRINARRILGPRYPDFERLTKSFENAGIESRYSVVPFDWFEQKQDWPSRTKAFLKGGLDLFVGAAEKALHAAGLAAEDIDTLVTVSSTGIATPTLEARAMQRMAFRPDVHRVPVFGLGCAGGVTGLSLAARLAAAAPDSKVLFVCLEACTLSFRDDRMQKADIIATVLFGDGAAAACLSTDGEGIGAIGTGAEYTWPDSLNIMGWDVDERGFGVIFDRSIPEFVRAELAGAVNHGLGNIGMARAEINRLVCHPGGAKVVEAIETALDLVPESLGAEREVLRDFGNMSAPTVLFVLERVLAEGARGQMVLTALGPGFTASLLPIRV